MRLLTSNVWSFQSRHYVRPPRCFACPLQVHRQGHQRTKLSSPAPQSVKNWAHLQTFRIRFNETRVIRVTRDSLTFNQQLLIVETLKNSANMCKCLFPIASKWPLPALVHDSSLPAAPESNWTAGDWTRRPWTQSHLGAPRSQQSFGTSEHMDWVFLSRLTLGLFKCSGSVGLSSLINQTYHYMTNKLQVGTSSVWLFCPSFLTPLRLQRNAKSQPIAGNLPGHGQIQQLLAYSESPAFTLILVPVDSSNYSRSHV